jgi:hypothetical protein
MDITKNTSTEVIERLRMIKGLCVEIATRLEDEASAQTIPRNFEYDGRRNALLEISVEIGHVMQELHSVTSPEQVDTTIQALFKQIEQRKQKNTEAQAQNAEYQHNFRMSGLYFTPRGAITGCEKALEWLRESLKSAGYPQRQEAS